MKPNSIVLLTALAVFGYWAYTRVGAVANLQFVPRGISINGGGFAVVIGVQNTSNVPLQYNSFAGSLIVNGQTVGNVSDFQPVPILANAESDLNFQIAPNLVGLAGQIFNQITQGFSGVQSAVLQGSANIGGSQYPINVTLA